MEEKIPDAMSGEYLLSLEELVALIKKQKEALERQEIVVKEKELSFQSAEVSVNDWEELKQKIPTWQEVFLNADGEAKRVLVNRLIRRIEVKKDEIKVGNGFYTTEYEERARSWATLNGNPQKSIVNMYQLDLDGLNILDLNERGVLAWIAEVVSNRGTNQEAASIVGERLVELYAPNHDGYDIIKGYRADDSYTQVVEAFLLNQINIFEVEHLFYKGSLGNQIFLKSKKAFEHIKWLESYEVVMLEEYKNSDMYARREVNRFLKERMKAILIDGYTVPGITARYAIQNPLVYNHEIGGYENASV